MSDPSSSTPAEPGSYVGADVLAAKYNVTTRHITGLAADGHIPSVKLGNVWRFDPAAVHEALTQPFTRKRPSISASA